MPPAGWSAENDGGAGRGAEAEPSMPVTRLRDSLLHAALLDGEPAIAAWAAARSTLSEDRWRDTEDGWLLSLVYRNLQAAGFHDADTPRLKGVYRRTWYLNQLRRRELREIVCQLQDGGVAVLVRGELPLALRYYKDLGLRPTGNVEILVREAQATVALELMASMGWQVEGGVPLPRLRRVYPRSRLTHPDGRALVLHWDLEARVTSGVSRSCPRDGASRLQRSLRNSKSSAAH
jgi:hypothetical protein